MQSLVKDIMGTIDITPTQTSVDWRGNTWFTGDLNTNVIKLQVIRNGAPVMLSENTTKAVMQIKSANGNYSNAVALSVMDSAQGIVGYTLDQEHNYPGAFNCQVALTADQTKQRAITVSFGFSLSKDMFTSVTGDQVVKIFSAFWTMYDKVLALYTDITSKIGDIDGTLEEVLDQYLKRYQDKVDSLTDQVKQAAKDLQTWKNLLGSEKDIWTALNNRVTYTELRKQMVALASGTPKYYASISAIQTAYPNGAAGMFYGADTGHVYAWDPVAKVWADCGTYQATAIGDRDVKRVNLALNVPYGEIQWNRQWIIDDEAKTLTIPSGWGQVVVDTEYYGKPAAGTYNMITNDSGQTAFYIGYSTAKFNGTGSERLAFYASTNDIPESDAYLGWCSLTGDDGSVVALHGSCIMQKNVYHGQNRPIKRSDLQINLPYGEILYDKSWVVDVANKTLIVPDGWGHIVVDTENFDTVPAGTYPLITDDPNQTGFYVGWTGSFDPSGTGKFIFADTINKIPSYAVYLGWISVTDDYSRILMHGDVIRSEAEMGGRSRHVNRNDMQLNAGYAEFIWGQPWNIDTAKKTLTVPDSWGRVVVTTELYSSPAPGTYSLITDDSKQTGFFVGWTGAFDPSGTGKFIFADNTNDLPSYAVYLGWISMAGETIAQLHGEFTIDGKWPHVGVSGNGTTATAIHADETLSCLGDSITAGDNGQGQSSTEWSWPSYMQAMCGFNNVTNVGRNGSTISSTGDSSSFVERCTSITGQDFITVFGGVNDYDQGRALGEADSTDVATVSGGLNQIILTLTKNNPDAVIVIMTPMKENKFVPTGTKNKAGLVELDYVNAIKAVADKYSIPVLDLYTSGNNGVFLDDVISADGLTADKLHPTAKGYKRLARQIAGFINAH